MRLFSNANRDGICRESVNLIIEICSRENYGRVDLPRGLGRVSRPFSQEYTVTTHATGAFDRETPWNDCLAAMLPLIVHSMPIATHTIA